MNGIPRKFELITTMQLDAWSFNRTFPPRAHLGSVTLAKMLHLVAMLSGNRPLSSRQAETLSGDGKIGANAQTNKR
jgi:hypothetical protein